MRSILPREAIHILSGNAVCHRAICPSSAHWQGLNPGNGHGWNGFTTVIDRIKTHLSERVVWKRPSDIAAGYHE